MKKSVLGPEHFAPFPHWYFTFIHSGNISWSLEQDLLLAVTGKFRKSLKSNTAGDSPYEEGKSRTQTFSL
jgi:hypothetical protein